MAIVTNGAPDTQRTKLSRTGLDGIGLPTIVAGEIGIAKPNPEPFLRALDQLGIAPGEAVFVGRQRRPATSPPPSNLVCHALLIAFYPNAPGPITLPECKYDVISTLHAVQQYVVPGID